MDYKRLTEEMVQWIQDQVRDAGCKGIVYGLSGGIDSAVVSELGKRAFGKDSLGIIMPIESNHKDEEDALYLKEKLDLNIIKVDLTDTFRSFEMVLPKNTHKMALANIKPRLRMMTLYYYAQSHDYLVVGTSNKSEFHVGYFTKYGDSGSDMMPLADLLKTEVWELAKYLKIPDRIIDKKPSAGLWEDQTDEKEMGFTYQDLDQYIKTGDFSLENSRRMDRMHRITSHKRHFAKIFKKGMI